MKPQATDMHPKLLEGYLKHAALMQEAGILFTLTCVLRTPAEQAAFYAQGRQALSAVNALRTACGMETIGNRDNSYTVTQTMKSRHFPDAEGRSHAYDIVLLTPGRRATWDTKWDLDRDNVPEYEEAARLGEQAGLVAGAHWKTFKDYPHFQLP